MYLVRQDDTKEYVETLPYTADIQATHPHGKWLACREKYGKRDHWYSEPLFIDTETSHDGENVGWIHQWAVCWGNRYYTGRTSRELTTFLTAVSSWAGQRGKNWKVLGYIHNMGYDMEYLRSFFPDEEPSFFAVKPHRILTAKWRHIELRCSYLLTQKSLDKWGKDSAKVYKKLKGTYDYTRVLTPSSPLTDEDWSYQLNDVAVMRDAWIHDREHDHYDARNVPLTSTGFVRQDCREASEDDPYWRMKLDGMQPDLEVYDGLEQAFAGGYTHGNRFVQEQVIEGPIGHRDFCSSYPARQIINSFPMGAFTECDITTAEEISYMANSSALLLHVALKDPCLRDRAITAPYLGWSKCHPIGQVNEVLDNGRVISLYGVVHVWLTELDFLLILRQYKFEFQIIKAWSAPKGKLPKWLRGKIMEYFLNKCTLKHSDHATYMRCKAMLNGIFGMSAQKYIRDDLTYENGEWYETALAPADRQTELEKVIRKKTTFQPFCFGVWTTALARYALFQMIELGCGYENFLYADTDSIFYIMTPETEERFEKLNRQVCRQARKAGGVVEYEGKSYTLGEFSPEEDMPIQKFTFVHAKCYAVIDREGKEQVTVAGVTKHQRSNDKLTNADELGPIENLKAGFIFKECGGTRIVYNNDPLRWYEYQGEQIEVASSAVILNTEYQVSNLNEMDEDDALMQEILSQHYRSDIYGDWSGLK